MKPPGGLECSNYELFTPSVRNTIANHKGFQTDTISRVSSKLLLSKCLISVVQLNFARKLSRLPIYSYYFLYNCGGDCMGSLVEHSSDSKKKSTEILLVFNPLGLSVMRGSGAIGGAVLCLLYCMVALNIATGLLGLQLTYYPPALFDTGFAVGHIAGNTQATIWRLNLLWRVLPLTRVVFTPCTTNLSHYFQSWLDLHMPLAVAQPTIPRTGST